MERWKTIHDFPNYEISDKGTVRNSKTGRIMKQAKRDNGYMQVCLRNKDGQKAQRVHRLVATAFCDRRDGILDVNHIDGDKSNNDYTNLEWCTRKDNIHHSIEHGLTKTNDYGKPRISVYVHETNKVYNSIRECARDIGVDQSIICGYLNGRLKSCHGYHIEKV